MSDSFVFPKRVEFSLFYVDDHDKLLIYKFSINKTTEEEMGTIMQQLQRKRES